MPVQLSANYSAQLNALVKGPARGVPAPASGGNLKMYSDVATMAVGTILSASEYVRFMKIPKGAVIHRSLGSYISTSHTAAVAGKIQLVPTDGSAVVDLIPAVTANIESSETTSIPDVNDDIVVPKEGYLQFVPASDLAIATTDKKLWLRLMYSQTY